MKKIGFIGAFDKTNVILYTGKILTEMGKTVLIVDTTITQKAKYVVPVINPTKTYFTQFEDMDIAVGFDSEDGIKGYLGLEDNEELSYDFVLIDIDSSECFNNFSMEKADKNYFVTSLSLYSLKRGLEILAGLNERINMTKVIFSKYNSVEENEYIDFLSEPYNIEWNKDRIAFPLEQGDESAIIENERSAKIKLKNLTQQYKDSIAIIVSQVNGAQDFYEIKKIIKKLEKGV